MHEPCYNPVPAALLETYRIGFVYICTPMSGHKDEYLIWPLADLKRWCKETYSLLGMARGTKVDELDRTPLWIPQKYVFWLHVKRKLC